MSPTSSPLPPYCKPWLPVQDQVELLRSRGLVVADACAAAEFLRHVNYFRFSGYCLAFEVARHEFAPGITFQQVQASYEFDATLRDVMTEALEVVEVDMRTNVAYHFGRQHGAFGHADATRFFGAFRHSEWLTKLRNEAHGSKEPFVTHFRDTYREFPDLPIWVVTEIMSFGALSHMCHGMLRPDQKAVAANYGLQPGDFVSWMHHLTYVRNLCAHHARLWDRLWSVKPQLPYGATWRPPHLPGNGRLFATLLILRTLLRRCPAARAFSDDWRSRIEELLASPPAAPNADLRMGLPPSWKLNAAWR